MQTRELGNTGLHLTVMGIGTSAIGGTGWEWSWGEQNENDSVSAIVEGLECGANWIDTAPIYGCGASERIVGKVLEEWQEQVFVSTKCCGLASHDQRTNATRLQRQSIIKECEDSLRRLRVEAIDIYQIHWADPSESIDEAFLTLLELQHQGKIRWPAVSNFSVSQLERVTQLGHCASLQPPYSLLRRTVEDETLPWCGRNRVGVISYSPLQCGLLTGKVDEAWLKDLPDGDFRKSRSVFFREPALSRTIKLVQGLEDLAAARRATVSQLAIAWVLRRKEITSAIVGIRKKGQFSSLVAASDMVLSNGELRQIEELYGRIWDV